MLGVGLGRPFDVRNLLTLSLTLTLTLTLALALALALALTLALTRCRVQNPAHPECTAAARQWPQDFEVFGTYL